MRRGFLLHVSFLVGFTVGIFKRLRFLAYSPVIMWEYGLVSLLLSTIAARGVAEAWNALIPEKYPQLTVGDITWNVGSKQPDNLILLGFFVGFFAFYWGLRSLAQSIQQINGSVAEKAFRQLLLYAMLPTAVWIGIACVVNAMSLELIICSTVLVLLTLIFAGALRSKRILFDSEFQYLFCVGSSVLTMLFAVFNGVGLVLTIGRLRLDWRMGDRAIITATIACALTAGIALLFAWSKLRSAEARADISEAELPDSLPILINRLRLLLGISQALLPLLFFILLPTPWLVDQQKFYGYAISPALYGVIAVLIGLSYLDLGIRLRKAARALSSGLLFLDQAPAAYFSSLSPLCLMGLLLYIKSPIVEVSAIPADDYHRAEFMLPWFSWQRFHEIPFWDYEPPRGVVNYATGLFATLFLNGNAASHMAVAGNAMLLLPFLIVAFWAISRSIGYLPTFLALALMPNPSGLFEIDWMATAGLCLMVEIWLKKRWLTLLGAWLVICLLLIMFAPGNGGLLAISTVPLAGFAAFRVMREKARIPWKGAIAILLLMLLVLLLTPFGKILLGAFRYGAEQSSLNSVAYGVEWFKSRGSNTFLTYSVWEFVRILWIVASVGIGLLIYRVWANPEAIADSSRKTRFLAFAIPILIMTVLLIPRSAGRIDPGGLSRLGNTSMWVVSLLLPLVLLPAGDRSRKPSSLLLVAFLGSLLCPWIVPMPNLAQAFQQPIATVSAAGLDFVDGKQTGLPNLDGALLEPVHLQRIQKVKAVLDTLLEPTETYLDLANLSTLYFYLGRLPLMEAAYNTVHPQQQIRALQRIRSAAPPVVLTFANSGFFDGGSAALRTHLIYRYLVLEGYIPVMVDDLGFLVRRDRLDRLTQRFQNPALAGEMPSVLVGDSDPVRLDLLDRVFRVVELRGIPRSWGKSFGSLQAVIRKVSEISPVTAQGNPPEIAPTLQAFAPDGAHRYRVTGAVPSLTYNISALNLDGDRAGLLAVDVNCRGKQGTPTLAVRWQSKTPTLTADQALLRFTAHNGRQLVPLDTAPGWLLAKGIQTLQLELTPGNSCSSLSIENLSLYQRAEVEARSPG